MRRRSLSAVLALPAGFADPLVVAALSVVAATFVPRHAPAVKIA